jgi:endonuclease III
MVVHNLAFEPSTQDWFKQRATEYMGIANRLAHIRHLYENAELVDKRAMWFRAYLFSVLSVQTLVAKHEASYLELIKELGNEPENYLDGERLTEIMARTKCGHYKTKSRAITKTARLLLDGAIPLAIDDPKAMRKEYHGLVAGLRYIKLSFMMAMLGYPVVCIDTWVARYLKLDYQNGVSQKLSDNLAFYEKHENRIVTEGLSQIGDYSKNPFLYQWILFDYQRQNGVTQHDIYFESMESVR